MSKTGVLLSEFAKNNSEIAAGVLTAIENLAKTANEAQSQVAEGLPFELIGDIIAATLSDMVPSRARTFINMASFFTMLITLMVATLLGRKMINSFFAKRIPFDEE